MRKAQKKPLAPTLSPFCGASRKILQCNREESCKSKKVFTAKNAKNTETELMVFFAVKIWLELHDPTLLQCKVAKPQDGKRFLHCNPSKSLRFAKIFTTDFF